MPSAVNDLQRSIAYQFNNPRYLLEALRTAGAGYIIPNSPITMDGNKRLAQLGDAILRMITIEDWYLAGADRGTL